MTIGVEEWRQITGWPLYEVSDHGRVRNVRSMNLLKPVIGWHGYLGVGLYSGSRIGSTQRIHRLVAAAFIGFIQPGMEVNHIDGDKRNNNIDNLEIVSRADNRAHAMRLGLIPRGEANTQARLSEDDVRQIFRLKREQRISDSELATRFGVTSDTIGNILGGRSWRHLGIRPYKREPKTHCKNGHLYTDRTVLTRIDPRNGKPYRDCKVCISERRSQKRETEAALRRAGWVSR